MTLSANTSFDAFCARGYLNEYYGRVEGENDRLLSFHADAHQLMPCGGSMLEFGGGPTLYQLASAAARSDTIHFTDYLAANRDQVRAWVADDPEAFSWTAFIARALQLEGARPSPEAIAERETMMRERIVKISHADAFAACPVGDRVARYDKVAVNFVLESITTSRPDWQQALGRVAALVRPGGHLVLTAITGARYWMIGDRRFPATCLTDTDLVQAVTDAGLEPVHTDRIDADVSDPAAPGYEGYTGMGMLVARRLSA